MHAADASAPTHLQQQHMLPSSPSVPASQQHPPSAGCSFPAAAPYSFDNMPGGSFSYNDAAAALGSPLAGMHFAGQLAGDLAGTDLHAAAGSADAAAAGVPADTDAAAAASGGPPVLAGSQVLRSSTAKKGSNSWVATSCLVPEGLPTAAAAEAGGGLACMEVVCRVLVLQDCCPAAASPGLVKALSKGEQVLASDYL